MNQLTCNRIDMFGRVVNFGKTYRDRFPETTLGGKMFAAVTAAQLRIDALAASSTAGNLAAMGGTASKTAARAALVETLEAISRTAQAVAIDHPAVGAEFRLPRRQTAQTLLTLGAVFVGRAAPYSEQFIEHGLRPTFLDDLRTDLANFQQAIGEKAQGLQSRVDATDNIRRGVQQGLLAVQRLDAIVANTFTGEPDVLAQWERARYVARPAAATKTQTTDAGTASQPDLTANDPPAAVA